jgi:hypothetical protein
MNCVLNRGNFFRTVMASPRFRGCATPARALIDPDHGKISWRRAGYCERRERSDLCAGQEISKQQFFSGRVNLQLDFLRVPLAERGGQRSQLTDVAAPDYLAIQECAIFLSPVVFLLRLLFFPVVCLDRYGL